VPARVFPAFLRAVNAGTRPQQALF